MRTHIMLALCFAGGLLCMGRAAASVEFCPATLESLSPIGATLGAASAQYSYELTALAPRSVGARFIADTNAGWFGWSVDAIALKRTTRFFRSAAAKIPSYDATLPALDLSYQAAVSDPLAVAFPHAVIVRHAWVLQAKVSDAAAQPSGPSSCDVPDFFSADMAHAPPARPGGFTTPSPLPSPSLPAARAEPASPPFAQAQCATPFMEATVKRPAMPEFPLSARQEGLSRTTVVEVAVGNDGDLVDAWVLASSGSRAIDLSVLRAARASEYSRAVSYCRAVNGLYLFRADFQPQ